MVRHIFLTQPTAGPVPGSDPGQQSNDCHGGQAGVFDAHRLALRALLQDRLKPMFIVAPECLNLGKVGRGEVTQFHIGYEDGVGSIKVKEDVEAHETL